MNKKKGILIAVVIFGLLVLSGVILYLYKINGSSIDSQKVSSHDKLFEFFDIFTQDKDIGIPKIEFMYPEEKLIVFSYPISQETASFAVYDYKNKIFYKNIGSSMLGEMIVPEAFIGSDKLLMYKNTEDNGNSLFVQDFNNNIVKTISNYIPSIYEVYPKYGEKIRIYTDEKHLNKLVLDTKTLNISVVVSGNYSVINDDTIIFTLDNKNDLTKLELIRIQDDGASKWFILGTYYNGSGNDSIEYSKKQDLDLTERLKLNCSLAGHASIEINDYQGSGGHSPAFANLVNVINLSPDNKNCK
jgi:hypothetical protein